MSGQESSAGTARSQAHPHLPHCASECTSAGPPLAGPWCLSTRPEADVQPAAARLFDTSRCEERGSSVCRSSSRSGLGGGGLFHEFTVPLSNPRGSAGSRSTIHSAANGAAGDRAAGRLSTPRPVRSSCRAARTGCQSRRSLKYAGTNCPVQLFSNITHGG